MTSHLTTGPSTVSPLFTPRMFALHTAVLAFLAIMLVSVFPATARADTGNSYRVGGIAVTGQGKTPAAAKAAAVAQGRAQALQKLLRKLTRKADHPRLPRPDNATIAAAMLGFEVEQVKTTPGGYSGRLAYRFKRDAVNQILERAQIAFVRDPGKPTLMLAVWHQSGTMMLWDEPNPWREAWDGLSAGSRALQYVRAEGDLSDLQAVAGDTAVRMERASLEKIARKYKAGVVLVSYARPDGNQVRINVRGYRVNSGRIFQVGNFAGDNTKAGHKILAARIADAYEANWKQKNLVADVSTSTLTASVPLSGYGYWVRLRNGLASVPLIRRYKVLNLSPSAARLQITHVGKRARLAQALRDANILMEPVALSEEGAPEWRLRMAGTPVTALPGSTPPNKTDLPGNDGTMPPPENRPVRPEDPPVNKTPYDY